MKQILRSCLVAVVVMSVHAEYQLVDQIDAIVYLDNDSFIVTRSEVARPGIDGAARSLQDVIFDEVAFRHGRDFFNIRIDDAAIDRHVAGIQKDFNLTSKDIEAMAREAGYTTSEWREEFRKKQTLNSLLDYRIRTHSKGMISEAEVHAYHDKNPLVIDASVTLRKAEVSFDGEDGATEAQKTDITKKMNNKKSFKWSTPFTVVEDAISEQLQSLITAAPGSLVGPFEASDGYEVFLVESRVKTHQMSLEDRYDQIMRTLSEGRFNQMMNEFRSELMDTVGLEYSK